MKINNYLFSELYDKALNNGGATLETETAKPIDKKHGYMVGIKEILLITKEHLEQYTDGQLENRFDMGLEGLYLDIDNLYMGSWYDKGSIYIDLSVWVDEKDFAIKLGKMFKQKAIYDLKNEKTLDI